MGSVAHRGERQQHRANCWWVGSQPDCDLRGDPEGAFTPHERPPQIEAVGLVLQTTEHGDLAIGQHDLDGKDMSIGDTVGKAVRTSGVVGNVAAQRADLLARRIGREVEALGAELFAQIEIDDSGFDPRDAVLKVDLDHVVHLPGADHDRRTEWDGASGESRSGAARDDLRGRGVLRSA